MTDRAFERAASIFRAVGDESRLRLLYRLWHGEKCVTELAEAAGVGLSTVSQQLRFLRAEHLVTRRRLGKQVFYALADAHVANLVRSALDHALEGPVQGHTQGHTQGGPGREHMRGPGPGHLHLSEEDD